MGDQRTYNNLLGIRVVEYRWYDRRLYRIPEDSLNKFQTGYKPRKGVNRIVYDITSKPRDY